MARATTPGSLSIDLDFDAKMVTPEDFVCSFFDLKVSKRYW